MFGPALMVCPVYTYGARQRQVYFPAGSVWYDYYTGARIEGGQTLTVDAPYEHIPLFVRAGSILPVGPEMQYSDEKQPEVIDLYLYPGQDGQFSLYEDEGVNYNYEKGQYALIHFTYHDAEGLLEISPRKGEFPGMLKKRTFRIIQGNKQPVEVQYDGVAQMVNL
jgi:alpha-D-xyloside xylohydrolase